MDEMNLVKHTCVQNGQTKFDDEHFNMTIDDLLQNTQIIILILSTKKMLFLFVQISPSIENGGNPN